MLDAHWGTKRTCGGCQNQFFDLGDADAPCPLCAATPSALRARQSAAARACFSPPPELLELIIDDGRDGLGDDRFDLTPAPDWGGHRGRA